MEHGARTELERFDTGWSQVNEVGGPRSTCVKTTCERRTLLRFRVLNRSSRDSLCPKPAIRSLGSAVVLVES